MKAGLNYTDAAHSLGHYVCSKYASIDSRQNDWLKRYYAVVPTTNFCKDSLGESGEERTLALPFDGCFGVWSPARRGSNVKLRFCKIKPIQIRDLLPYDNLMRIPSNESKEAIQALQTLFDSSYLLFSRWLATLQTKQSEACAFSWRETSLGKIGCDVDSFMKHGYLHFTLVLKTLRLYWKLPPLRLGILHWLFALKWEISMKDFVKDSAYFVFAWDGNPRSLSNSLQPLDSLPFQRSLEENDFDFSFQLRPSSM